MKLADRKVDALHYEGTPITTVYVRLNDEDCRKKADPSYRCIGNCEGSLLIARLIETAPFSIKALVPEEFWHNPQLTQFGEISCPEDFKKFARKKGFSIEFKGPNSTLYYGNKPVGAYNACGLALERNMHLLFSQPARMALYELLERVDEIPKIATSVPLEAIVQDKALASQLGNPRILELMVSMFGKGGREIIAKLQEMQRLIKNAH